jgi:hypothetical protein
MPAGIGTVRPKHWRSVQIDTPSEKPMDENFKYRTSHSPSISKLRKVIPHIQQLIITELLKLLYNLLLNSGRDEISCDAPVTQCRSSHAPNQADFMREGIK